MKNYTLSETIRYRLKKDCYHIIEVHLLKIKNLEQTVKNLEYRLHNLKVLPYSALIHMKEENRESAIERCENLISKEKEKLEYARRRWEKIKRKLEEI